MVQVPSADANDYTLYVTCPLRLARIEVRKNGRPDSLWPILLGKFLIAFFFHWRGGPAHGVCLMGRVASIAFVCIRRERFASERHCERTRNLDATNYQSLSRNNKAKPWKKIPVKSIAFHMHLARFRAEFAVAYNRRAKIKLKAECCGKKRAIASVSFVYGKTIRHYAFLVLGRHETL